MSNLQTENEIYYKVLGNRIRTLRKDLGYKSFNELKIPDLNSFSYSYIERGERDVKFSSLLAICRVFGITLVELLDNIEEEVKKRIELNQKATKHH